MIGTNLSPTRTDRVSMLSALILYLRTLAYISTSYEPNAANEHPIVVGV
jgi:hypothetical protein